VIGEGKIEPIEGYDKVYDQAKKEVNALKQKLDEFLQYEFKS